MLQSPDFVLKIIRYSKVMSQGAGARSKVLLKEIRLLNGKHAPVKDPQVRTNTDTQSFGCFANMYPIREHLSEILTKWTSSPLARYQDQT